MTLARVRPAENSLKYSQHAAEAQGVGHVACCRIAVIGVGTAGGNTVTRLMESASTSAKCIIIDTDAAHLKSAVANHKILIGQKPQRDAASTETRNSAERRLKNQEIMWKLFFQTLKLPS